ncbi:MAG: hypothetical protein ACO1O1_05160 [Adhaeribacter sp.]
MEILYFKNKQLSLYFYAERRMVRALWDGFLSGDSFRSSALTCTQLLEEKAPLYWLADNRKMKAIRQKDQDWFEKEIMPRLATSSLEKMATLVSEDIFNQMAVESLNTRSTPLVRFENRFFHDQDQALQWLLASPEG